MTNEAGYQTYIVDILKQEDHYIEFDCKEVESWVEIEPGKYKPCDLRSVVRGSIKWDGCSNLELGYPAEEQCMFHLCGKKEWKKYTEILMWLYESLVKLIPKYDKEVAE